MGKLHKKWQGQRREVDTLGFCCSFKGEALFWRMSNSFGYLSKEGYGGHVFPIVFGEVGSHLTAVRAHADTPVAAEGGISFTA